MNGQAVRVWGRNQDGTPYLTGMTVRELRKELERHDDAAEICVTVCTKKTRNGGGLPGKLKAIERGSSGQVWLKALVLDESLETK